MYASTHQMPLYPGTGAVSERGEHNTIVNAPLRPGDGGDQFRAAVEGVILPRLRDFRPDLIVISAGFDAAAGIGRTGNPTGGWKEVEANYPDLLPNAAELEAEYFARTGIYPMHGTIVVKDAVLADHPWVAASIYNAFDRAQTGLRGPAAEPGAVVRHR